MAVISPSLPARPSRWVVQQRQADRGIVLALPDDLGRFQQKFSIEMGVMPILIDSYGRRYHAAHDAIQDPAAWPVESAGTRCAPSRCRHPDDKMTDVVRYVRAILMRQQRLRWEYFLRPACQTCS